MTAVNDWVVDEVIHDQHPRARNAYRCDTCAGQIEKGEQYRRVVGKIDGDLRVFREHFGMCDVSGGGDPW